MRDSNPLAEVESLVSHPISHGTFEPLMFARNAKVNSYGRSRNVQYLSLRLPSFGWVGFLPLGFLGMLVITSSLREPQTEGGSNIARYVPISYVNVIRRLSAIGHR